MSRSSRFAFTLATMMLAVVALAQNKTDSPSASFPDRVVIAAALRTSIDAKNAKVGNQIELVVTEDVRDANGKMLLPKQAKLEGRVTEVVPWTKDHPESKLSIVVERAEWKGGSIGLRAFVAGDLKVYTALARPAPGAGEMVAAIEALAPGERPSGPIPANTVLPETTQ